MVVLFKWREAWLADNRLIGRQADKRAEISVQAGRWVERQMGRLESGLTSK